MSDVSGFSPIAPVQPEQDVLPPQLIAMFRDAGCAPPTLIWNPRPADLRLTLMADFAQVCLEASGADGRLRACDFPDAEMRPFTDWLIMLEILEDGAFYYSHYGERIADIRGLSMTGRTTSGFEGHIGAFFDTVYRAVVRRKRWIFTTHEPPRAVFARNWKRLIVPMFDDAGEEVTEFAVLNVPDNELRAGLEIMPDPVIIADRDRIVRFANRAARETFGRQVYMGSNMDLFMFAGIDLEPCNQPETLAASPALRHDVKLATKDNRLRRYLMTVGGIEQWGRAYFVLTLCPELTESLSEPA